MIYIRPKSLRIHDYFDTESDMAQWLERGALLMSLPAVRFRILLGAEFSENYYVPPSQSWDIGKMLCPWTRPSPSNASLDSGENEYLVGQRWQCVR